MNQINSEDRFAVAIKQTGSVVGHVPFNLAPLVSAFLRRDVNKGLVEVTGPKINVVPAHIISMRRSILETN